MENISPQRRYTRKFEMPTFRLGRKDPLEKEMAIHSSTIAWKIPWTEEPGRIDSMGSQRVPLVYTALAAAVSGAFWFLGER